MGLHCHSFLHQDGPSLVAINLHIALPLYATVFVRIQGDAVANGQIQHNGTPCGSMPSHAAVCGCVGCYSIACGRMQRDAVADGRIASSRDAYHGLRWNQDGCGRNRSLAIVWEPLRPQANQCEGMRFGAYTTIIVLVVVVVVKRNAMV